MNATAPVSIVALVTHARHVPAIERERFAAGLHREVAGRARMLETCHRVEAYLTSVADADNRATGANTCSRMVTGNVAVLLPAEFDAMSVTV